MDWRLSEVTRAGRVFACGIIPIQIAHLAARPIMNFMRFFVLWILLAVSTAAQTLTPVWVELGPEGQNVVRVIVETEQDCPSLTVDNRHVAMTVRRPVPEGFKPACEVTIP